MYIQAIRVRGLRAAPELDLQDLGSVVEAPSGAAGVGLADALTLFSASLRATGFGLQLERLGLARDLEEVDIISEGGFPVQAVLPYPEPVRPLVAEEASRRVTVFCELALDPPLYGQLRSEAIKDPRLVTALGQDPVVGLKVGWLFSKDLTAISISVLEVRVGDSGFPTGDPPTWMPPLLAEIGSRFHRIGWSEGAAPLIQRVFAAGLSAEREVRDRYRRFSQALQDPPFSLGDLELLEHHGQRELAFGPGLLRLRQHGPGAVQALRVAEAAHLVAPDVLVAEGAHGAARDWLSARTSGDDATLEQVILVDGMGAR